MQWSDVVARPTDRRLREFAACGVVLLCAGTSWQTLQGRDWRVACAGWGGALLLAVVAYGRPRILSPLFRISLASVFPLAWLMSACLLAVLFFGLITPLAVLFRLLGRDALSLGTEPTQDSYWQPRPRSPGPQRYFRQY